MLVVTKSDLGPIAQATRRDLVAALRALGAPETEVVAVSSVPPPQGIDELVAALDAHRSRVDLVARRVRGREHRLRLRPQPLREAARWLETYRAFWEARLDALEALLSRS